MKIIIKTKDIRLNRALEDFVHEKIDSLEKFLKIFQTEKYYNGFFTKGKPKVEAWVEIGKTTLHHRKGPFFWAECQMRFPKKSVRATATSKNLRLAITEVKDKLQKELKQYKNKLNAQTKRRTRVLKKSRFAPQARFNRRKGERTREEGL